MDQALDNLLMVHNGYNNFHNEPPHAKLLAAYVPPTGKIPSLVVNKYVKVLTMCVIGNGYGVSELAYPHYKELINRFSDTQILEFVKLLKDSDVTSRLQFTSCAQNYISLAQGFIPKTVDINLNKLLEMISKSTYKNVGKLGQDTQFNVFLQKVIKE